MQPKLLLWSTFATSVKHTLAVPKPQNPPSFTSEVPPATQIRTTASRTTISPQTTTSGDPCARLAGLARASSIENPVVPAQAAWDCLQAVPFDASTAEAWIESLLPYIQWQSTLSYLQDPTDEYQMPAVDVYDGLDSISAQIADGNYSNQYDFEFDIYRLFQSGYDGHFTYIPNMIGSIAQFGRTFALVSISSDGSDAPRPYVFSDILLSQNMSDFTPSPVASIDGQDAIEFLGNVSLDGFSHDMNAAWNSVFLELASLQLGSAGGGGGLFAGGREGGFIYPNASTILTFENGSSVAYENAARLLIPLSNITNAEDLYQQYVNLPEVPPVNVTETVTPNATLPAPGYPSPIIRQEANLAGGYYLEGDDYDDVAVLSLPSFEEDLSIRDTAFTFLDQAKADNKTKLIIDLSANPGGSVLRGLEVFLKLFPNINPYLGTRFRATESFNLIGEIASEYLDPTFVDQNSPDYVIGPDTPLPETVLELVTLLFFQTPFSYALDLDSNYEPFPSWPSKYGPNEINNDNFTSIIQWNYSQPAVNVNYSAVGIDPSNINANEPMFLASDIILLTDGFCASTCSIFVELMTQQAGVKSVVVGGRPPSSSSSTSNTTMQLVGGTRGANVYPWVTVLGFVNATLALTTATGGSIADLTDLYLNTDLGTYLGAGPDAGLFDAPADPLLPFKRSRAATLNVRDHIRRDDDTQTPLQFRYQPADCRVYWTGDMVVDITALWTEVVDVAWGNGACVAGSVRESDGNGDGDDNGTTGDGARENKRTTTARTSAKQRMEKRRLRRRTVSADELESLAEGARVWSHFRPYGDGGVKMF